MMINFDCGTPNQVDLESQLMSRQLSIFVVGQDVLRTNGDVSDFIGRMSNGRSY